MASQMIPVDLIVAASILTLLISFVISVHGLLRAAASAASSKLRGGRNAG